MLFNSGIFVVFFAIFLPLFLVVRHNVFQRNLLLIVASYVFYGWWDPRFLILVAVSTSVDYIAALGAAGKVVRVIDRVWSAAFLAVTTICSLAFASPDDAWIGALVAGGIAAGGVATHFIDRLPAERRRKYWLGLSLVVNLGILAFFKYFNFFAASLVEAVSLTGWNPGVVTLSITLPVGLSFYTFQAISRTMDSYRGRFDPGYSIINYAAFHAFFPQLVAGPIERAAHLMPQFETVRRIDTQQVATGSLLFLWGLYQKVVIADNVAPLANAVFQDPTSQTGAATLVGVLAFTFQIYCDFCGYSNMARGLARVIGFDLMINFNLPYFSRTPSEFWTRWHISLSSWLRDYLYIPLGGNRRGTLGMYRNLMITMLLGGLWHGAGWSFVAWGGFHGAIQVLYRVAKIDALIDTCNRLSVRSVAIQGTAWLVTMSLIMIGWVFFRARTFGNAADVLGALLSPTGYEWPAFVPLLKYVAPLIAVEIYQRARHIVEPLIVGPFLVRYTAALTTLLTILLFSAKGGQEFIYFDF